MLGETNRTGNIIQSLLVRRREKILEVDKKVLTCAQLPPVLLQQLPAMRL